MTTAPVVPDLAASVVAAGPRRGQVISFDAGRGLGQVEGDDGSRHGFHATAIADGSRRIEVGTVVAYTVMPGHGGRYEARSLLVVSGSPRPAAPSTDPQRPA